MARYAPVPAPPLERPLVHLLAAARTPGTETVEGQTVRWQDGISYETAAGAGVVNVDVCDPSLRSIVRPDAAGDRHVEAASVYATTYYDCSAFGPSQEYADRALAQLDAELPRAVEHELWTGELAAAAGLTTNRWLARDTSDQAPTDLTPGTGAVKPTAALGLLERALGEVYSGRGIIHLDRFAAAFLPGTSKPSDRIIVSKVGTYVVPGVGYPGTGPDGTAADAGEAWVYITPMVTVRVADVRAPGADVGIAETLDRSVNRRQVRARTPFTVDWDGPAGSAFAVRMLTAVE